jgi:hypothetical protein
MTIMSPGVWRLAEINATVPRFDTHASRSNLVFKLCPSHAPRRSRHSVICSAGLHLFCSGDLGYRHLANQTRLS